ncbi:MAG: hypothetical protein PVH88_12400 [Ignavibacteria bacterium]|jgi:hypothetical protein
MKLNFWKPTLSSSKIKATVHQNGNIGFSNGATQKLQIDETKYLKIGINEEDPKDNNLYVLITDENDENGLKVNKAGNYYYLNTKSFFNEHKVDYKKKKIVYDIAELNIDGQMIYKFVKREIERKKK